MICPPDHIHARTITCYKTHRCRCDACRARSARTARELARKKRAGFEAFVPLGPLVNHMLELFAAGMTQNDIATQSGVSAVTIGRIMRGKQSRVYFSTSRAILGVKPRESVRSGGVIDGTGTRRRLGALTALGYTTTELSALLGRKRGAVSLILHSQCVTPATRDAVKGLYDDLSMTVPPETVSAKRSRTFARKNGHHPPLAWDDASIDDPNATPHLITAGRPDGEAILSEVALLLEAGESPEHVANILGRKLSTITRLADRHGEKTIASAFAAALRAA
jgi:plasmid maintenance system antidote protein VapI